MGHGLFANVTSVFYSQNGRGPTLSLHFYGNLSGIFLKVRAPRSTCPIMPEAMEVEGAVEEVKKIKEDNDPENEGAFMRLSHLRFRMTKSVLPPAHLPHKRPAARRLSVAACPWAETTR